MLSGEHVNESRHVLSVCQLAHLAHGMTTQRARRRIGSDMPVWPVRDPQTNIPTQPIYDAARKRDQHQLGVMVDDNGGTALIGQVAPHALTSPVLIASEVICGTPFRRRPDRCIGLGRRTVSTGASCRQAIALCRSRCISRIVFCRWDRNLRCTALLRRLRPQPWADHIGFRQLESAMRRGLRRRVKPELHSPNNDARARRPRTEPCWNYCGPKYTNGPANTGLKAMGDTGLEPVTSALSRRRSPS
jgi:hypothetical protein